MFLLSDECMMDNALEGSLDSFRRHLAEFRNGINFPQANFGAESVIGVERLSKTPSDIFRQSRTDRILKCCAEGTF